ncbi:MAG: hypothetical protein KDB14_23855 [Planctomycetales bacterium]|nr:hypothetical protein [Planctomycetales bacterium]
MYKSILGLFLVAPLVIGCGGGSTPPGGDPIPKHDHDHEAHATTFPAAVDELVAIHDAVKSAMDAGDIEKAHTPLHEVGHVLENVEGLAEKLEGEAKQAATEAIDALFKAYGDVDQKLHGQKGADYADVSADIDAAVAVLVGLKGKNDGESEPAPEPGAPPATELPPAPATELPPAPAPESEPGVKDGAESEAKTE